MRDYLTGNDPGDENDFVETPAYAQPKSALLRAAAVAAGVPVVELSVVEASWEDLVGLPIIKGEPTK